MAPRYKNINLLRSEIYYVKDIYELCRKINAIELVTKLNLETKTAKTFIRCLDAIKLELI